MTEKMIEVKVGESADDGSEEEVTM